jgi:polysaccharide biosynthesis/export protein
MKNRVLLGLLAFVSILVGCAKFPNAPLTPADEPGFSEPIDMEPEGVDDDPPRAFRLRGGDLIDLHLYSASTTTITNLLVDATGTVHVPLVGPLEVGERTLGEAETIIEGAMRKYDQVVRVAVIVNQPLGHQASVLGAVETPGRVVIPPGTRLADLLAYAGGPTPLRQQEGPDRMADLGGARLVRDGAMVPVSVEKALMGDQRHNVYVEPGDHLYVPGSRGRAITMIGEVRNAGLIPYRRGIRLTQALAMAGGLTGDAHRRDIRVIRGPLGNPRVYGVNLKALVEGRGPDVELAPGDIVFVTRTGVANVRDAVGSIGPILATTGMFGANAAAILVTQ